MARLNEPPAAAATAQPGTSVDTVDAVKRRFLRQNRELAKTNSQQSIRIRNLENEGSRLLAENLQLREQVLQLQNAIEAQSNRPSFENIDTIKERLEAKMLEFGGLIAELGQLKPVNDGPRCKSQTAATRRSPDERQWRSGLCLQEVENAMLPTIVEDKHFPRRTMGADELRDILEGQDSQSPDIGPPPISRLEDEDVIAFNPTPPPEEDLAEILDDGEPVLSVNLETRKKRRESGPKLHIRRLSVFESPPDGVEEKPKAVRAGAKRKFSVQEDGDKAEAESDAFTFSRKNSAGAATNENAKESRPMSPDRPALGSKPVNTDPMVSPKKQRSSASEKPEKKGVAISSKPGAVVAPKPRGRPSMSRKVTPELPPLVMRNEPASTAEIHLDALPPKTPAAEEVLSPPTTEPSTSRQESKDTPPPGDLGSGEQNGAGGRPSRRARPQVSYKEPSLAAKMRRPGKEMVDAVQSNRRTSTEPTPLSASTTVKRESSESSSSWKNLPAVKDEPELGSPLKEKLDRREEGAPAPEPTKLNPSAASQTISALIAGNTKRKDPIPSSATTTSITKSRTTEEKSTTKVTFVTEKSQSKDNIAIFDFTDSSPNDGSGGSSAPPSRPRIDLAKVSRNARRHSSVPASSSSSIEDRKVSSKSSEETRGHVRTSSASSGTLPRSGSGSSLSRVGKEKKSSEGSNPDLRAAGAGEGEKDGRTSSLRAERAASRRKSMMV